MIKVVKAALLSAGAFAFIHSILIFLFIFVMITEWDQPHYGPLGLRILLYPLDHPEDQTARFLEVSLIRGFIVGVIVLLIGSVLWLCNIGHRKDDGGKPDDRA